MENTREKNKRADGRKKTYFDRENKKESRSYRENKERGTGKRKAEKEFIIVEMSLSEKNAADAHI